MKISFPKSSTEILTALALVSAAIRLYINYSTEFIPGAVGAFYLIQVRSVLETGSLAFREFPLLFYVEAGYAKLWMLLFQTNVDVAVNHACRIFDAVAPTISIFPAYLLVKKYSGGKVNNKFVIIISSFSIFYVSFFTLVSDYQKNSLGILLLFYIMFFVYKTLQEKNLKNYLQLILFFVLAGITHFGSFAVAIFFLLLVFTVNYLKKFSVKRFIKFLAEITIVLGIGFGAIYFLSPDRFILLIESPVEIFKDPIIISLLKDKSAISPVDLINIGFINLAAVIGLTILFREKNKINLQQKTFIISSIIACLVLASPFLGIEWGQRLYLISYVFAIPVLIFIFEKMKSSFQKTFASIIVIVVLSGSIITTILTPQYSNVDKDGFEELIQMNKIFNQKESNLVVARLGLNYWVHLVSDVIIANEEHVRRNWWNHIDNIYYLKQKKGIIPFGTAGLYGRKFNDPQIPGDADKIFEGEYYLLFRAAKPPNYLKK